MNLKAQIARYGYRVSGLFQQSDHRDDFQKLVDALEQLAEELERVERRVDLLERKLH